MGDTLVGSESLVLNGHVFHDFADGKFVEVKFPNDQVQAKASKNGNTLFAKDEKGRLADLTIRVQVGSADDIWLNSQKSSCFSDLPGFILMQGSYNKRVGDGKGSIKTIIYQLQAGIFKKEIEGESSAEGDVEQGVAVYPMQFANVTSRSIQ
ncbi:MAG: hypothetical protein NTY77_05645 [Elusimicrobia bacterium]|nr:hypothetical protein [Elusimicrobiota bacterium]